MSENLKYFATLLKANGYYISDIPFVGYVEETKLVLYCDSPNYMIFVDNNLAEVVEVSILRYTATSKVDNADNLGTVLLHEWDLDTLSGTVIYRELIKSIGDSVFKYCSNLTSIEIPTSITEIGEYAFEHCVNLSSINLHENITKMGRDAFHNCSALTSIILPNSLTDVGLEPFKECSRLNSVIIGSGMNSITYRMFYNCSGLTSIKIPNNITNIEDDAFYNCTGLQSITLEADVPPTISYTTWRYVPTSIPLYVPPQSVSTYQQTQHWSEFTNIQAISS